VKTTLLTGVAALFLATGAAHAGQRAHVIVGKPRIISTITLFPPLKYDKPYDGELEIGFFSNAADVQQACINSGSELGCTRVSADGKHCRMFLTNEETMKRKGRISYTLMIRHELAHCNGWIHPKTTEGRKFNVGDTWDKAEGAKWVSANTKVPMPKLPVLMRILPASPPVVCVTPDWQPESCEDRKTKAFSPKDIWSGGPKDIWSGVRPFQMKDVMR
jgi:hypothetical protein